jgi:hypothetical protein
VLACDSCDCLYAGGYSAVHVGADPLSHVTRSTMLCSIPCLQELFTATVSRTQHFAAPERLLPEYLVIQSWVPFNIL